MDEICTNDFCFFLHQDCIRTLPCPLPTRPTTTDSRTCRNKGCRSSITTIRCCSVSWKEWRKDPPTPWTCSSPKSTAADPIPAALASIREVFSTDCLRPGCPERCLRAFPSHRRAITAVSTPTSTACGSDPATTLRAKFPCPIRWWVNNNLPNPEWWISLLWFIHLWWLGHFWQ